MTTLCVCSVPLVVLTCGCAQVTRTLSRAAADLSHFCLLFACVVGGFAITGHALFGSRLEEFKSVPHSVVRTRERLDVWARHF